MGRELSYDFDVAVPPRAIGLCTAVTQRVGDFNLHLTLEFTHSQVNCFIALVPGGVAEPCLFNAEYDDAPALLQADVVLVSSFGSNHSKTSKASELKYRELPMLAVREFTGLMQGPYSLDGLRHSGWVTNQDKLHIRIELSGATGWLFDNDFGGVHANLLKEMWLHRDSEDFYIESKDMKKIRCHRAVLVAASPVFKAMLESGCQEGWMPFVKVEETAAEFGIFLEYVYLRKVPFDINCSALLVLLRLADFYQMYDLVEACATRLGPLLVANDVVQAFQLLRLLRNTSKRSNEIFHCMMERVRSRPELLEVMCMSVVPSDAQHAHHDQQLNHAHCSEEVQPESVGFATRACTHGENRAADLSKNDGGSSGVDTRSMVTVQILAQHEANTGFATNEHASRFSCADVNSAGSAQPSSSRWLPKATGADSKHVDSFSQGEAGALPVGTSSAGVEDKSSNADSQRRWVSGKPAEFKRKTRRGGKKNKKPKSCNHPKDVISIPGTYDSYR